MKRKNHLFQIQDNDTPMFVLAETMCRAIAKWRVKIVRDSGGQETVESMAEVMPKGVNHIAEPEEIIE